MNAKDRQDEIELLQRCGDAHGQLAALHRRMDEVEALLVADRDTEAEQVAREWWQRCQDMRAAFLRERHHERVAEVLEAVNKAEDEAVEWLEIVRTKTPSWSAWRRAGGGDSQRQN